MPTANFEVIINPRRACAARVTVLSLSVCESVTSLTATPLTHRHKGRYESKANAVLKVFDSWISLTLCFYNLCSYNWNLSTISRNPCDLSIIPRNL